MHIDRGSHTSNGSWRSRCSCDAGSENSNSSGGSSNAAEQPRSSDVTAQQQRPRRRAVGAGAEQRRLSVRI